MGNAANAYATVGGGGGNLAYGDYATVGGGEQNFVWNAQYATVPGGFEARASHYGEMAYASGVLGNYVGDAQTSLYVVRNTTLNGIQTELFLDGNGASQRITIASGRTVTFDILVVARTNGGSSAGYRIVGVIENQGGATAFIGTPTVTTLGEDVAAWDVAVVADNTNDALEVKVTGAFATTIGWVASVRTVEVSY